jgi:TPR repeat protein
MKTTVFFLALVMASPSAVSAQALAAHEAAGLETLRQAAEKGDVEAMLEMGILYEYGFNLPHNKPPALAWYMLAADLGHPKAAARRDFLKGQMTSAEIEEAKRQYVQLGGGKKTPPRPEPAVEPAPAPPDTRPAAP